MLKNRFENKEDALNQLLHTINKDIIKKSVVLTISQKGIFYAKEIGLKNGFLEGDFLFIEKVLSPVNKETPLAVVSETKDYVIIEEFINSFEITDDYVFSEINRVFEERILEDIYQLRAGEGIISIEGRDVLLIDESSNSGLKLLCAIKSCLSKKVNSINVAVPVISKESADMIGKLVDNTFFVKIVEDFVSVEHYFKEYK